MNPFTFLTDVILNALIGIYKILQAIQTPFALGFAIIILTVLIRLALWSLVASQFRQSQKMAALKPHLDRIKVEHGHDKIRHREEVAKLYKEHNINPLGAFLPLLIQIPVFIALSNTLSQFVKFDTANFLSNLNHRLIPALNLSKIPDTHFFGASLANSPNQWQHIGLLILIIPILTGILQFVQSQMTIPQIKKAPDKTDGKTDIADSMAQASSQMVFILPLMLAFFSYNFSVGLSLYWNTFTVVNIVQQYIISGPGGLNKYLPNSWRKEQASPTSQ